MQVRDGLATGFTLAGQVVRLTEANGLGKPTGFS